MPTVTLHFSGEALVEIDALAQFLGCDRRGAVVATLVLHQIFTEELGLSEEALGRLASSNVCHEERERVAQRITAGRRLGRRRSLIENF